MSKAVRNVIILWAVVGALTGWGFLVQEDLKLAMLIAFAVMMAILSFAVFQASR